jgi:hypothetical protein
MSELSVIELDSPPDDFLPDEPEGAAFHKAFLASGIRGFQYSYLAIYRNGARISIVPCFYGKFSLTALLPDGLLKRAFSWIKFSYACAGHPSTDFGLIDGEASSDVLALVNATLSGKTSLIAYKGFPENLPLHGFSRVRGLPVAVLFTRGDYYAELDAHRRNDFHHKLAAASALRIEAHSTLPEHLLKPVYELYLNTLAQAKIRFEILTPDYFRKIAGMGKFHLYFEGERLIGFLQMISKGRRANLKYMGMDHERNRLYYLYFAMCLHAIEAAMRQGCTRIELGVSSYQAKRLMGCELIETCIYFRHNNPLANWLLNKFKFLLEPAPDEL